MRRLWVLVDAGGHGRRTVFARPFVDNHEPIAPFVVILLKYAHLWPLTFLLEQPACYNHGLRRLAVSMGNTQAGGIAVRKPRGQGSYS